MCNAIVLNVEIELERRQIIAHLHVHDYWPRVHLIGSVILKKYFFTRGLNAIIIAIARRDCKFHEDKFEPYVTIDYL